MRMMRTAAVSGYSQLPLLCCSSFPCVSSSPAAIDFSRWSHDTKDQRVFVCTLTKDDIISGFNQSESLCSSAHFAKYLQSEVGLLTLVLTY